MGWGPIKGLPKRYAQVELDDHQVYVSPECTVRSYGTLIKFVKSRSRDSKFFNKDLSGDRK